MKICLKVRSRGKRGFDISSVPVKSLEKARDFHKKRWEYVDGWLVLEAF